MTGADTARLYHELTSYAPEREWTEPVEHPLVRQDVEPNDLDRLPPFAKRYPAGRPTTPLPRDLPRSDVPATAVLAGSARPGPAGLDLPALARLLFRSAGVVRVAERNGREWPLRAAGSAGARYPLELYVAARSVPGLPDGVHWYDPLAHALVRVGPAPAAGSTAIVITGVPWRTGWRYVERGFRHLYWDAGTTIAHLQSLAAAAGLPARLTTTFPDAVVTALVGADGVHEFPLAAIGLGEGAPALEPGGEAAAGTVDDEPVEFPLVTAAQRAGDGDGLGEPWPEGAPLDGAAPASPSVDDVIDARTSTRRMDPTKSVPASALEWPLAAATRGIPYRQWLAVHAVDGHAPGLYRWPELASPRRPGPLRDELYRICLEQGLPADAAYVVISTAELAALDGRGYREAQLAAGIVSGRLHLAAHALGIGACGMTFLDSEVPGLLGTDDAAMLMTCVGTPAYRARPGGPPGRPASVRIVTPRVGSDA